MSFGRLRFAALAALLLMLVPAMAACGGSSGTGGSSSTKQIKVGLVTDTGGLNDRGFNALAYQGLQKAITQYNIKGDVKESKSADDYVPNLQGFATGGYDLVIGVGFLMQQQVGTVATNFPKVNFALIDGAPTDASGKSLTLSNVQSLFFKEQDAGALVGVISGMLEKDGKTKGNHGIISAVGGIKIPPVDHYIAGYQWGAKLEKPDIKVLVGYSNDFADSAKCRDLANTQIAANSDIVFQVAGGCGLGALKAATEKGVYSIGVDTDQKTAEPSVIASALKRVEVATFDSIESVVKGNFKGGTTLFGLDNDGVGYAPGNITLSQDILDEVNKVSGQIKSGAQKVPDTVSQ